MASFRVNGKDYPMPEDFTLGEIVDMEQHFGVKFGSGQPLGMSFGAAALYVAIRRVDPSVTVDDIREMDPNVLKTLGAEVAGALPPDEPHDSTETSGEASSES